MGRANNNTDAENATIITNLVKERQQVEVAFNLHRNEYSVRVAGRVVAYTKALTLQGATFRVNEKGRQAVIASGTKNLHAFTSGVITSAQVDPSISEPVRYNPYEDGYFKTLDGTAVESVGLLHMFLVDGKYRTLGEGICHKRYKVIGLFDDGTEGDIDTNVSRSTADRRAPMYVNGLDILGTRVDVV